MYTCITRSDADLVECDYYNVFDTYRTEHRIYSSDMELNTNKFYEIVVRKTIVNGSKQLFFGISYTEKSLSNKQ